jgi:predicted hotdog family 3-hydroxylacyl-ACP dehydratase
MNLLAKKITDASFVQSLIPQKAPFIMVDKLLFYSEKKVVSGFTISEENIFTRDTVFTAPGLIEHMAQTVALYTGYQYFLLNKPAPTGYIGAIKKVEIDQLPKVGQELTTSVIILHDILGVTLVQIETDCEGTLIAASEMKTVIASR